jgi:hypothetical protein
MIGINDVKKCSNCFQEKPIVEYYIFNKSKDGRQSMCIPCYKQYYKQWRQNKKESPATSTPQSKVCQHCHLEKPISQFGKRSVSPDKKHYLCLPCHRIDNKKALKRYKEKKLNESK